MKTYVSWALSADGVEEHLQDHPDFVEYGELNGGTLMYREEAGIRYWLRINHADRSGLLYYYTEGPEESAERDWADDIHLPDDIYGDESDLLKWRNTSHRH